MSLYFLHPKLSVNRMGDNETHVFIISDAEDDASPTDDGEGDFVISDDDENYMELARRERIGDGSDKCIGCKRCE